MARCLGVWLGKASLPATESRSRPLEAGSFRWPRVEGGVMRLTPAQFAALVEGLDWARVRGPRVPRPTAVS